MKCILIDSINRVVREVEIDEEQNVLRQYYWLLKCSVVRTLFGLNDNDSLIVDADGTSEVSADSKFFEINGKLFVGNGLVRGSYSDVKVTTDEVENMVTFQDIFSLSKKQKKEFFR